MDGSVGYGIMSVRREIEQLNGWICDVFTQFICTAPGPYTPGHLSSDADPGLTALERITKCVA